MIENDLDKVLNYMKRYVENVYEHDSEIMLNWKDIKLVLEEIERLNNIIKEAIEYIKKHGDYNKLSGCIEELDLYKINELLDILKGSDKE